MTILLAGDIGGTKTILRVVRAEPSARTVPVLTALYEATYASREYPDLIPMVEQFLRTAEAATQTSYQPDGACFGIAGPVIHGTSKLTNLCWKLDQVQLQRELHIPQVTLINDFAAVGYGVLGLLPEDVVTLRVGEPDRTGPIAIIGAGTGLGEGYVIPTSRGYQVFATEGGHTSFAPRSEMDYQLVRYLQEQNDLHRISVERVVSGMGIHSIYLFMHSRGWGEDHPAVAAAFKTWQQELGQDEKTVDLAAVISQHAQAGSDRCCVETMRLFVRAYGAEAGDMALKLLPSGGLYIAGGIAAKNLPLLQSGEFLHAFDDKGRVRAAVEKIPIHVVLNPRVGLIGAAICAAQRLDLVDNTAK